MQSFFLVFLSILNLGVVSQSAKTSLAPSGSDHVSVQRRKIVVVRPAKLQKAFPHKKRATITYPVISGLSDPVTLRRVRSLFDFKNIFDYSLKEYREDTWLDEFDYEVNYNQNSLLDITFRQSGSAAYPDDQQKHFLVDLTNGRVVKASDAFEPHKLPSLAVLVDGRLQDELRQDAKDLASSKDSDPQELESIKQAYENLKFEVTNLDDFSVGPAGVTFLYDAGFPHVIRALEPAGRYFFNWAEIKPYIKPNGPLAQFVR